MNQTGGTSCRLPERTSRIGFFIALIMASRSRLGAAGMAPISPRSVVPVDAFAALVTLLRFNGQRGDRPRIEALQRDRLAGFLAITIGAVVEPAQCLLDFRDQLALTIAGPQFDRAIGFR